MNRLQALIRMLLLTVLALFFCSPAFAAPSHSAPQQPEQELLHDSLDKIHIRPATKGDTDDITTVLNDAFAPSAGYHYLFPHYDDFRDVHWACLRKGVVESLANLPSNAFINVISVPVSDAEAGSQDRKAERVVAVAGWIIIEAYQRSIELEDTRIVTLFDHNRTKCSPKLYTNKTREHDYSRQYDAIEKRYVRHFSRRQLYLAILATHPDYDGHGFGAANVLWGLEVARKLNVPTTLMATPAGWPLYDSLGFESIANATITTLDWPVNLWNEYMRYEVRG